ncbi:MAG: hypothetical protein QME51_10315 [Planctomycetota bacterium]|nr:hypothetical protein [Planctomycetota bacterium]
MSKLTRPKVTLTEQQEYIVLCDCPEIQERFDVDLCNMWCKPCQRFVERATHLQSCPHTYPPHSGKEIIALPYIDQLIYELRDRFIALVYDKFIPKYGWEWQVTYKGKKDKSVGLVGQSARIALLKAVKEL